MSDDGRWALTVIAMLGAVFSPAYARARRRGDAHPLEHCAMNVALYGPSNAFCLTERPSWAVSRSADELVIGSSRLRLDDDALELELDEERAPRLPVLGARRLRARVRLDAEVRTEEPVALDGVGRHRWHPYAPSCRAQVELPDLGVSFSGSGYADSNWGDEPLEAGFSRWTWSRTVGRGPSTLTYDAELAGGETRSLARHIDGSGAIKPISGLARLGLPRTRWGLERTILGDPGTSARHLRSYEDTPFYSRSLVETVVQGERRESVHEALSLDRFRSPVVQFMLPYRMLATP